MTTAGLSSSPADVLARRDIIRRLRDKRHDKQTRNPDGISGMGIVRKEITVAAHTTSLTVHMV